MKVALFVVAGCVGLFSLGGGERHQETQDTRDQRAEPRTRLEAFQSRRGVVIIRGSTAIGTVAGRRDTSIDVQCKEFTDTGGRKELGLAVSVKIGTRDEQTSYVDYDEIDPLIAAIDYLTKVNKTVTHLASFQADYRTNGDLTVSIFTSSDGGTLSASVASAAASATGAVIATVGHFSVDQIGYLREVLTKAKARLDEIK